MPHRRHALQPPVTLSGPERSAASAIDWACARSSVRPSDIGSISPAASTLQRKRPASAPVSRITALAPFLGSTMRWALGLTCLHANTTAAPRGACFRGSDKFDATDASRSCRFNRCSARSITIVSRSPLCAATVIYSERNEFSFKLRVNAATFSVNCRIARNRTRTRMP
jgi:hypothetical protein